ncbi:MAG: hypothetical protein IT160_07435 [Bryobacterales bacterium]|nr:hypothetical protein [Bryobacterales bacterium]
MRSVVWVHEDMLRANHPIFVKYPAAPAAWVWDDADLRRSPLSMKRIILRHQAMEEMPVSILRGDSVTELLKFAAGNNAERIATVESSNPRVRFLLDRLAEHISVDCLPPSEFAAYEGQLDVRDFARYWRSIRPLSEIGDDEVVEV